MASNFWQERLVKLQLLVVNYEDAIAYLTLNPTAEYTLDTGQDRQQVKKHDLAALQTSLNSVLNMVATIEARCQGAAMVIIPEC